MFWPRVWQMACRLEEIPKPGDFVEYEILDESIIVVRVDADTVRAYHNACRHRGVKLVEGNGNRRTFVCPFHGWCWGIDGRNTFVLRPEAFAEENMAPTTCNWCRSGASSGADARGSTSTTTPRRCATASSRSHRSTTPGRSSRCASSGGSRAGCR